MQIASPLGSKEAATLPAIVDWQEGDQGDGVAYNIKSNELGVTYVIQKMVGYRASSSIWALLLISVQY